MSEKVTATFEVSSWDEQQIDEAVGVAKLTRAEVTQTYSGDIDGSSVTQWLMAYAPDKSATFVGLERVKGTIGGRHGSLVLQHVGRYDNGAATSELTIVSGTNELKGAEGSGSFKADPAGSVTLDISFGD